MFKFIKPLCLAIAGGVLASAAAGQTAPDATGTVAEISPATPPQYQSVFSGYRTYTDQPLESWQNANQKVHTVGGWRAYAKEAHAPEPTNPSPQKATAGEQP